MQYRQQNGLKSGTSSAASVLALATPTVLNLSKLLQAQVAYVPSASNAVINLKANPHSLAAPPSRGLEPPVPARASTSVGIAQRTFLEVIVNMCLQPQPANSSLSSSPSKTSALGIHLQPASMHSSSS